MKLSGSQFEILSHTLLDAYDLSTLKMMVRTKLDTSLDQIAGTGNLTETIHDLISWAEKKDRTIGLIYGACKQNSTNTKLQEIKKTLFPLEMALREALPDTIPIKLEVDISTLAAHLRDTESKLKASGQNYHVISAVEMKDILDQLKGNKIQVEKSLISFDRANRGVDVIIKEEGIDPFVTINFFFDDVAPQFRKDDPNLKRVNIAEIASRLSEWKTVHTTVQNLYFSLNVFELILNGTNSHTTEIGAFQIEKIWFDYCHAKANRAKTPIKGFRHIKHRQLDELHALLEGEQSIPYLLNVLKSHDRQGFFKLKEAFYMLKPLLPEILSVADFSIVEIADQLKGIE